VTTVELPHVGAQVQKDGAVGAIESVKVASDLYSPVSGEILGVNQSLTGKPELVNEDAEGAPAWPFLMIFPQSGAATSCPLFPRKRHRGLRSPCPLCADSRRRVPCAHGVRFGSQADIALGQRHVRFIPESGHHLSAFGCPLCAKSGHQVDCCARRKNPRTLPGVLLNAVPTVSGIDSSARREGCRR
jgi:Glycine cleavage H-protein